MDEDLSKIKTFRVFVKNGRVMPGFPGFKPKGDGITTCYCCGKLLTDPLSFARGVGPECIVEWGPMPGREWIEEFAKAFKAYQSAQKRCNQPIDTFKRWHAKQLAKEVIKL